MIKSIIDNKYNYMEDDTMTEATKKLIEMLYYDDYLYHLYIRSGRDKLLEKLQQRISNNSESKNKKELEIIDYINKHKNEIHE